MTSRRRWLIVAVGVLVLAFAPYAASKIPAGSSDISARTLLARVAASADVPYSGYAEADGGLAIPAADRFGSLVDLLGAQTDMRIWWRQAKDWRVDAVSLTGETDVHQDAGGLWSWDYERNHATRVDFQQAPAARLPRADDLAPGALARRLLVQATPSEVSRLPDQRIAGHDAAGLRLRPAETASTIDRVDVWAVPSSGLPVKVEVYGRKGGAVLSTTMLDLATSTPTSADTVFAAPDSASVENDGITDIVSALDRFVVARPPARLAGLARSSGSTSQLGSVGVYGRGVTAMIALPLPARLGDSIESQLAGVATVNPSGVYQVSIGPLSVRATAPQPNGSRWLLAGTVSTKTLATAEKQLPAIEDRFR